MAAVAGKDQLLAESLRRKMGELKSSLLGVTPSPLEKLAVGRVCLNWMQSEHLAALLAGATPGTRQAAVLTKQHAQASRQYDLAISSLATIRRLLPTGAFAAAGEPAVQPAVEPAEQAASGAASELAEEVILPFLGDAMAVPQQSVDGADRPTGT